MLTLSTQEGANILTLLTQAKHDRHPWDNVTAVITSLQKKVEASMIDDEAPPPAELLKKPAPRRKR